MINIYVCVMYVVLYVLKLEKIFGDIFKVVSVFGEYLGFKMFMKSVVKKFLIYWEVSV